ncbi:hypothetical protein B0H14DRAFT_3774856 [Mycena olivaceomarginata]|nr:hypothetical protein B0H14DRAFT_3774856 [Mycena olivaceomarginata]
MPPKRRRRDPPSVEPGVLELDLKKCQHCGDHIVRNLAQHEKICKILCANRRHAVTAILQQQQMSRGAAPQRSVENHGSSPSSSGVVAALRSEMQVEGGLDVIPEPELPLSEPMDVNGGPPQFLYPPVSFLFATILMLKSRPISSHLKAHHPHISLRAAPCPKWFLEDCPYAPFRNFADYSFASHCVKRRMPNTEIDEDLRDMHNGVYSSDCFVTFHNHRDLQKSLKAARISNVPFCSKTLVFDFDGPNFGKRYEIKVEFRDPWKIIKRWACDPTLAHVSTWFSQEKYLCLNGIIDLSNPLYDEPCSGESWREVDDNLPGPDDTTYLSCYLGLHVWLDKGLVSTKVKMHPILFRGSWIDSATRNGSGETVTMGLAVK